MKLINKILQTKNNSKCINPFNQHLINLTNYINSLNKELQVYDNLYKTTNFIHEEIFDSIILDLQYIDYEKYKLLSNYETMLENEITNEELSIAKNTISTIKSTFANILTRFEQNVYHDVSAVTIKNEMKRVFNLKKYATRELDL